MVTTIVPAFDGPIPPYDVEDLRSTVHEWLVSSRGDEDKAGEIDTAAYYEGWADACQAVLEWLLGARGDQS